MDQRCNWRAVGRDVCFLELQERQAGTMFSAAWSPFRARGMT